MLNIVAWEIQIKPTMYICTTVTTIEKTRNTKTGTIGTLSHCRWECQKVQPLWNTLKVSHKIKHKLSIWISNPIARYSEIKTCSYKDSYVNSHYGFIHNSPKLENTSNIHQQVSAEKILCIAAMIKRNKLLIHTTSWMNLKNGLE